MGNYVNSQLDPGEQVVYQGRLHWVIYLNAVILLGIGIVFAVPGVPGQWIAGLAILGIGVISAFASWLRQVSSEFAVTNRRVIIKTGFVSRRTIELNMSKVESVQVDQGLFGRLLGYGTITLIGTGGTHEAFPLLDNPLGFRHAVQQQQG